MACRGCKCDNGTNAGTPRAPAPEGILVIDDDFDCRMLIRDAIAESGIRTVTHEVSSAETAWQFLRREGEFSGVARPALIFLDVEMPGIDGIQLLRQIKTDPSLREITVVMMTGVSDEPQMRAALAAGANSYTLKPANAAQFLQMVVHCTRYWLTVHQRPEQHLPAQACRR